jgi:hypothetical protein
MRMTGLAIATKVDKEGRSVNEGDRAKAWEMSAGDGVRGLVGRLRRSAGQRRDLPEFSLF